MSNPGDEVVRDTEVNRNNGAGTETADALDQYRYSGSPEDQVMRTSGEPAERAAFRREADQKLNPIFTSLEAGRNNMVALHELARSGQGPGTQVYEDTFKAAKQAYFQAIEQSKQLLFEQGPNGELVPNKFFKDVDAERQRLAQEKQQIADKNSAQYKELARQEQMMQDVLRAYGYSHANFGMALIRSSVYYPKEQRDAQKNQGHQMMMLAASKDPWMMGDPPNVPPDPNFNKHWVPIMKAVDNTPYVNGPANPNPEVNPNPANPNPEVNPNPANPNPTTNAELPAGYQRKQVGNQTFIEGNNLRVPTGNVVLKLDGQTPDANDPLVAMNGNPPDFEKAIQLADQLDKAPLITNIEALKAQLTPAQQDLEKRLADAKAQPTSVLGRYAVESENLNNQQTALKQQIQQLGAFGLPTDGTTPLNDQQKAQQQALGWMWNNVRTTQELSQLLQSTDPNLKPIADALKSHPKFNEINSTFGQFLNNKVKIAQLEDGLKNATDPTAKDFFQRRQQFIAGSQQLQYLTALYISPITAREARVMQLRQDPEVQELIGTQDKTKFTKGNDPEVQAIRKRVNELVQMQGQSNPQLTELQRALGDTTAAATPPVGDPANPNPTAEVNPNPANPNPEVARTNDNTDIPADLAAKVAPLQRVEQAFTGAGAAFGEMAALHRFATEVKLLRDFDAQVKALPQAERTPEKIADIQKRVFANDEYMGLMYGPDKKPNLANEIPTAIQEAQARNFASNPMLAQKYSLQAKPNLANEVQLDPTGKYLKEVPADVKAFFDQAQQVLQQNSPEKIQEMVDAQRQIYQMRLDKVVPKAEQQTIQADLARLQGEFDKAMAALKPELKGPLAAAYADLQTKKGQIGGQFLQQIPQFQSDLQQVLNTTQPNSDARMQALGQLQQKFMSQVEANPQYQQQIAAAEEAAFKDIRSMDPGVDAVLNAQKNLDNYTAGIDPNNPQASAQDRQARAMKIASMDAFMTATKDLDALAHTTAVVQSYQARALLLSPNQADHQKALDLMTASSADAGAARYLALPANEMQAARYMLAAAGQVMQANAPVDFLGSMVPGSGAIARGLATSTNGYIMGSRLENQNAATLALAEGYKFDPVFTEAQIAAATAEGNKAGNGLVRDAGSIAAYGGTYWASGLLKFGGKALPGPLRIIPSALAAGGTSDYLEDYKLDGPINDPGAWARGGIMGLGAHGAYNTLLGKWSTSALQSSATARMATLGEATVATEGSWLARHLGGMKATVGAYANPRNIFQLNAVGMGEKIATADAAAMIAINRNLAAMSYYRTVGTAFTIGSLNHGAKIVDGQIQVTGAGDALNQMAMNGAYSGLTSGVLVPMSMMVPRMLAPIPKWGLGKVPGVMPFLSARVAPAWDAAYAMGRTYASDFSQASSAWSMAHDLEIASSQAQNPDELWKAIQKANPGMNETTARARALMTIQMQKGQAQARAGG